MKKKFFNAKIYRNDSATEFIVKNGKISEIGTNLPSCEDEIDLQGKLIMPPYVDPHLHLDYVYTGRMDGGNVKSGTLFEGIERWHHIKKTQGIGDAKNVHLPEYVRRCRTEFNIYVLILMLQTLILLD